MQTSLMHLCMDLKCLPAWYIWLEHVQVAEQKDISGAAFSSPVAADSLPHQNFAGVASPVAAQTLPHQTHPVAISQRSAPDGPSSLSISERFAETAIYWSSPRSFDQQLTHFI